MTRPNRLRLFVCELVWRGHGLIGNSLEANMNIEIGAYEPKTNLPELLVGVQARLSNARQGSMP